MRVPQISNSGLFRLQNFVCKNNKTHASSSLINKPQEDTVSFSSKAKYYKKYATLPDEIKEIISPEDAVEMFKNMEQIAQGSTKDKKIGQGHNSSVYDTPWLDDYCILILHDTDNNTQVIYSSTTLGDAVWADSNDSIQIIKKIA